MSDDDPSAGPGEQAQANEDPQAAPETSGMQGDDAAGPGDGGPGVAGDGQGPDEGAYVPPRGGGPAPAMPAAEPDGDQTRDSKQASYEKVTGKAKPAEQSTLDNGSDAAYSDLAANQRMVDESTSILSQGLRNEQGSVTLGDYSPAMTQTVIIHTAESRRIKLQKGTFAEEQLRRIRQPHIKAAAFDLMRDELSRQHLIIVHGEAGGGRRATAVNVLASLGLKHIGVIDVESDVTLRDVAEGEWLEQAHGHVLEIAGEVARNTVTALSAKAAGRGSYLVIIRQSLGTDDDALDSQAFAHQPAPAQQILLEQLSSFLEQHQCEQGCTESSKTIYVRRVMEDVKSATAYTLPWQPWEIVKIARRIADSIHNDVPIETLVRRDPAELRHLAVQALAVDSNDGKIEASRRQGFRIAYAVFHACFLADVIKAGDLFGQILPLFEKREKRPDHVVFDGMIDVLLDGKMWINRSRGTVTAATDDVPRRAQLTDQALAGMFLDVVWNDFDALRGPVMVWLDLLAGWNRPVVQIRAATAAGFLATFDFDEIYRVLIGDWARGSLVYRQSAAYALQMAARDARLTERVRRQVKDWAKSSNPRLQDSAARAYGWLIGADTADEALEGLRRLAGRSGLAGTHAIAVGIANLFPHNPQLVLSELAQWNTGRDITKRRHADRALLLLAKFAGPNATEGWPPMFQLAADDRGVRKSLATMWADALMSSDTARDAWEPLRKWIVAGDSDSQLAEVVRELARDIFDGSNPRAVFHLIHWRHRYPESLVLKAIYEEVVPQEYRRQPSESRS